MSRWHGPGGSQHAGHWALSWEEHQLPPRRRLRAVKRVEAEDRNAATPAAKRRAHRDGPPEGRNR